MTVEAVLKDLPQIKTERLTLRRFTLEDVDDVFEYTSDPQVAQYALWNPVKTVEDSKKALENRIKEYENHNCGLWGAYHNEDKRIIGTVGFFNINKYYDKAELGYTFSRKYWGKGYATEVVKALIDFGFKELELQRIEGVCHPDNIPSIKVLEKGGMIYEGTLRKNLKKNDEYLDSTIYSIIKEDYFK